MTPVHAEAQQTPSIAYDDWSARLLMAGDIDQVVKIVRDYLTYWTPEQLHALPWDLGAIALASSEDIVSRAVIASRAELKYSGDEPGYKLLREMALTYAAAANRLRFLQAFRNHVL